MAAEIRAFTAKSDKLQRVLFSETFISPAFDPKQIPKPPKYDKFIAIWDTGATNTVISKTVVEKCGLKPIAMVKVYNAGGEKFSAVYMINIILPNDVGFPYLRVTEGIIYGGYDVLIGMDIINRGDFAVTNKDAKTAFSFRIPSIECIDFAEHKSSSINPTSKQQPFRYNQKKPGPNEPCSCGSGKKYKKCCGK